MDKITEQEFLYSQGPDKGKSNIRTERFYLNIANKSLQRLVDADALSWLHEQLLKPLALCLTGYYQDVIADGGPWHTFVDQCRSLYGKTLPFYEIPDEYVDYELNYVDIRFMVWYFIAMSDDTHRNLDPYDSRIETLAKAVFGLMEEKYEEAPIPEDNWTMAHELEMNVPEDIEQVYAYGLWLFMHCYLMTPAFALSLHHILSDPSIGDNDMEAIGKRLDAAMNEDTIGPLAFYMREWLHLIIDGKLPSRHKEPTKETITHKYYQKMIDALDGQTIAFFKTYSELNRFFIDVIGWEKDENHLPQLSDSTDFVVMVNREKGMLVAKDIAKCIASPSNPLYDKAFAEKHAFELLTVRGKCPVDLLKTIETNGWLPDASFPGSDNTTTVADNLDFIARCYLQGYYRGD